MAFETAISTMKTKYLRNRRPPGFKLQSTRGGPKPSVTPAQGGSIKSSVRLKRILVPTLSNHPIHHTLRNPEGLGTKTTMRMAKLLVPVDFSAESKNALRYAGAFARQFGASLTLLHVVEPIVCAADFGYGPVTRCSPNQELLKKAKTRLNLLGKRLASSQLSPAVIVRTGVAETDIVEEARHLGTDLIVMGTRGACGLEKPTLGSTTEGVVRHAPCPVFVVRKKEHEFVWCGKSR